MTDKEIISNLLEQHEWQTFECKRAQKKPHQLLETVIAFANTDGGILVLGLEDPDKASGKSRLIGIKEGLDNISEFLKLLTVNIEPQLPPVKNFELEITNVKEQPDKILIIKVEKSSDVHSLSNGDTFIRNGRQNNKIGSTKIVQLKYEKGAMKYEDECSEINRLDDLDFDLIEVFKRDVGSQSMDTWQLLKDHGLSREKNGKTYLTKSCILLFAKNPAILLGSKCGIKISHYYGTKPDYSGEPNFVSRPFTIEGPLYLQIKNCVDYFREIVQNSPPKLIGAVFRPSLLIPEWVFQEAITNAVVHRNYSLQDDIQLRVFDDKVIIESPGSYPGHITTSNIRTERFSRNPIIQRCLNRFQNAPNLDIGEGVDRMFQIMKQHNLYEPIYIPPKDRPNSVMVVLLNIQKIEYWDTVSAYLDKHHHISNREGRAIIGVKDTLVMSRLLTSWCEKGLIVREGGKRNAFYHKPGISLDPGLFSRGYENKT